MMLNTQLGVVPYMSIYIWPAGTLIQREVLNNQILSYKRMNSNNNNNETKSKKAKVILQICYRNFQAYMS